MISARDKGIIRELAFQTAEIASLPVQDEKRQLWKKLNALKPDRPMVMIDQVCWNEMNVNDELTLLCEDPECKSYEAMLRRTLYQWKNFPVDMVVDPFIRIPKAIHNTGFGIEAIDTTAITDPTNDVVGHTYANQFETDEDLEKIQTPILTHDTAETARRLEVAHELFDNILDVFEQGIDPYLSVWDPIAMFMSVEDALFTMIDRPNYMLELANRMVAGYISMLDQAEDMGLLGHSQSYIHCTGAYTDELPAPAFDPAKPRSKDIWMFGLAQMFSTVSPEMYEEFEINTSKPLFERFGLVYYGCCDPLDKKMNETRKIPNLRKISMSPWVDEEVGAAEIGGDYVYSRKPNPALLARGHFDELEIRKHLKDSVDICKKHGCPLELILKDISTVCYEPQRLNRWADIAMELVNC